MLELPSDDVGPLVEFEGKVPVALDPVGISWIHDGLTGWSNGYWLGEVGFTALSYPGDFWRESFNVILFDL